MRKLQVCDLGKLEGDVLLFGGPYSNLHASRALLERARALGIGRARRICTGDLVAYCAHPLQTVDLWRHEARIVAGNCERQLAADAGDCGCGFEPGSQCERLSHGWYQYAQGQLSGKARDFMAGLPDMIVFSAFGARYAVIHGGLSNIAGFIWPVSPPGDFMREIRLIRRIVGPVDGVIAGHCGYAFEHHVDGVHWINAGAIGMPQNDGRSETRFAVLGTDGIRFEHLQYDVRAQAEAMRCAGLTQGYETALESGFWPSENALPSQLRGAARHLPDHHCDAGHRREQG